MGHGKWCYLVENRDPDSGARTVSPLYREIGSYVAYVKVWDVQRTALKPSMASNVTVR